MYVDVIWCSRRSQRKKIKLKTQYCRGTLYYLDSIFSSWCYEVALLFRKFRYYISRDGPQYTGVLYLLLELFRLCNTFLIFPRRKVEGYLYQGSLLLCFFFGELDLDIIPVIHRNYTERDIFYFQVQYCRFSCSTNRRHPYYRL